MITFKEEVVELLSQYNMTQVQLAEKIDCHPVTITKMFKEDYTPSDELLVKLKLALPAFDLDSWRIYFGKLPDEFYEVCRMDPDLVKNKVFDLIHEIVSNHANK